MKGIVNTKSLISHMARITEGINIFSITFDLLQTACQ